MTDKNNHPIEIQKRLIFDRYTDQVNVDRVKSTLHMLEKWEKKINIIKDMHKDGFTVEEIEEKTHFSLGFISDTINNKDIPDFEGEKQKYIDYLNGSDEDENK